MTTDSLRGLPTARRAPGPAWYEMINTAIQFRQKPLEFLQSLKAKYGDVVRFQLGPFTAHLVSNPTDVATVLTENDLIHKDKLTFWALVPLFGNGVALSNGDAHRYYRKLVAPAFYQSRLKLYSTAMVECVQNLVNSWHDDDIIDLETTLADLTLDILVKTLFDSEAGNISEIYDVITNFIFRLAGKMHEAIPTPYFIPTKTNREMVHAIKMLETMATKIIKDHKPSSESRKNILSMLIEAKDEQGKGLSPQQIANEVKMFLMVGHETAAHFLLWVFYQLSKHPEVFNKVQMEIDKTLQGRLPTINDLPNLVYTEMVMRETLRLYPGLWANGREAVQDVYLSGYKIKKGDLIFVSPYLNQRDPNYFKEPEAFLPERFSDGADKKWQKLSYYPFAAGEHICLGRDFAMTESLLILATIISQVKFNPLDDGNVNIAVGATLRPDRQIQMKIQKRSPVSEIKDMEEIENSLSSSKQPDSSNSKSAVCPFPH
jgi:cytochrome P450